MKEFCRPGLLLTTTTESSSCKQTLVSVTVLLCDYCPERSSADDIIQGDLLQLTVSFISLISVSLSCRESALTWTLSYQKIRTHKKRNTHADTKKKAATMPSLLRLSGCCALNQSVFSFSLQLKCKSHRRQHLYSSSTTAVA